jgi:glutamine synthetase
LEADDKLIDLFSQPFVDSFVSVKRDELADFSTQITPWEIEYLGSIL